MSKKEISFIVGPMHIQIFNITGMEMKSNGLDLGNLPSGVYFIKYHADDNSIQGMVKCIISK